MLESHIEPTYFNPKDMLSLRLLNAIRFAEIKDGIEYIEHDDPSQNFAEKNYLLIEYLENKISGHPSKDIENIVFPDNYYFSLKIPIKSEANLQFEEIIEELDRETECYGDFERGTDAYGMHQFIKDCIQVNTVYESNDVIEIKMLRPVIELYEFKNSIARIAYISDIMFSILDTKDLLRKEEADISGLITPEMWSFFATDEELPERTGPVRGGSGNDTNKNLYDIILSEQEKDPLSDEYKTTLDEFCKTHKAFFEERYKDYFITRKK